MFAQHHQYHASHEASAARAQSPQYRRILWIALLLNFIMFGIEIAAGMASGSVSLLADAIDFLGDGLNYGVSLTVLSMALVWRSRAAMLKAASMMTFGLGILGKVAWSIVAGSPPEPLTMGVVGALALAVNLVVAWMLYAYREGDANMRSVWLCSRNDAIGNIAVMLAALGVATTRTAWPDLLVASLMGALAIHSAWSVMRQARDEIAHSAKS